MRFRLPNEDSVVAWREWLKVFIPGLALVVAGAAAYGAFLQLGVARDSAERQQRAYMLLLSLDLLDVGVGKTPYAHFVVKNFGNTPAFDVAVFSVLSIGSSKPGRAVSNAMPSDQTFASRNLGPTDTMPNKTKLGRALTKEEVDEIAARTKVILLDVIVVYRDIFQIERRSTFHLFGGDDGINMYPTGEGDLFN